MSRPSVVIKESGVFYKEHNRIATKLEKAEQLRLERINNPSRTRAIWSEVGSAAVSLRALTGPLLRHKIDGLQEAYDNNIKAAAKHKDDHFVEYVHLAQAEMNLTLIDLAA